MPKDIYIFRHGETDWNKENRIQGCSKDIPLNENGIMQAKLLVENMRNIKLDKIISSPLSRALKTAEILAEAKGITVIIDDRLKEINFGIAEGKTKNEINPEEIKRQRDWFDLDFAWTNGNTRGDALTSVMAVLNDIVKMEESSFGIATHGGVISTLLGNLGMNYSSGAVANGKPFYIKFENEKFTLMTIKPDVQNFLMQKNSQFEK
ncbi:MAG: histidine phosphatase family protein [Rickettsiales bacterium]|jgi:broad specificity phosphatase PhoE|nr:histidine phosphatase family protein [Rickettsiales bacterium]